MNKLYDLAVKTGSYQKDGETKNRYENIGGIFENDNGKFIMLKKTFNPAGVYSGDGKDSIIISMFATDKKQGNSRPTPNDNDNPFSDADVPF